MMDVRPLRTEADHAWALAEIEPYFDDQPAPGSLEGDRFDVLAVLIEAYENQHHAIAPSDPVEILHFAIEEMGRSQAELAELLGSRSRASEVLRRKRSLTLDQIRAISGAWNLPIEALTPPYPLDSDVPRQKQATCSGRGSRMRS